MNKIFQRVFFLLFVIAFFSSCEQKTIINGVDEKEANEIIVILASKGISATKVTAPSAGAGASAITLYNIQVSDEQHIQAMAILNQYGLPRLQGQTLLNIFSKQGLVPSEAEEKIRYHAGLEAQLSTIIRKIDGVIDADVQLSIPTVDPMKMGNAPTPRTRASVFVKHQGILDDPNSHLTTKIKRLVASGVPNLDFEDVTVVTVRARYSEVSYNELQERRYKEQEYVSIWGVVISKDSLGTFRFIFFSLWFVVLVFLFALVWVGWKFFPIVQHEGWRYLFKILPYEKGGSNTKEPPSNAKLGDHAEGDDYDFQEDKEGLLDSGEEEKKKEKK